MPEHDPDEHTLDYDDEVDSGALCDCDPDLGGGLKVVCVDDVCRATGGCGRFTDATCYGPCSNPRCPEGY